MPMPMDYEQTYPSVPNHFIEAKKLSRFVREFSLFVFSWDDMRYVIETFLDCILANIETPLSSKESGTLRSKLCCVITAWLLKPCWYVIAKIFKAINWEN